MQQADGFPLSGQRYAEIRTFRVGVDVRAHLFLPGIVDPVWLAAPQCPAILGRYQFDGDTFIYQHNQSGRINAIRGYPVKQLLRVMGDS